MLGNLEENFWGWSDPNAIYLLDYWKQLDPTEKEVRIRVWIPGDRSLNPMRCSG